MSLAATQWSRRATWTRPYNSRRAVRYSRAEGTVEVRPVMTDEHVIEPSDHLFRREAGRMVATLTRIFGVHNLALAEDVVQDAFCRALEVWKFRGVPENPSAWLMATAKTPGPRRAPP